LARCPTNPEEALERFSLGLLDLKTRAQIERLFWSIAKEIYQMRTEIKHIPEELLHLPKLLSDKYFCNFSLFQCAT
jgi:arginine decarboxylase